MNSWYHPLRGTFKLNFDGSSKGNTGPMGFGGVCHDSMGSILSVFYGSFGTDSNNAAKIEWILQGVRIFSVFGWMSTTVDGYSRIII